MQCLRLKNIMGYKERHNDVIFCGDPLSTPSRIVIFFGGDVQVYTLLITRTFCLPVYLLFKYAALMSILSVCIFSIIQLFVYITHLIN